MKRDDAAEYHRWYSNSMNVARASVFSDLRYSVRVMAQNARSIASIPGECELDACTDELARRGLCASVLNWWHKKPAGDELEW